MILELHIEDKKINLQLKSDDNIVDESSWEEENDLGQTLLPKIDELLKKNNLETEDVEKMKVVTDISSRFTTVRIAKTVAKGFNLRLQ